MKNLLLTVIFLFLSLFASAQKEINTEFATKMNLAFQPLEKKVPHNSLLDYCFKTSK